MASPKDLSGPAGNTVIGPSILINGKLSGDEDLTVRGRVEGELALTRTLIVEPSGVVKANVSVKNAVVSGVVVGNIAATESVELTRDGRMVGDIRSPRVIIVDGASFRGRVDMGELAPGRPLPERPRTQLRPAVRAALAPARPPALPPRPAGRVPAPAFISGRPAESAKAPPAPPPAPPTVAAGAKKKIVVKKKR
jgi:cytoskeletal protein CcmA (bactofilin family)